MEHIGTQKDSMKKTSSEVPSAMMRSCWDEVTGKYFYISSFQFDIHSYYHGHCRQLSSLDFFLYVQIKMKYKYSHMHASTKVRNLDLLVLLRKDEHLLD